MSKHFCDMTLEEKVNTIWFKQKENHYSVEASDLSANDGNGGTNGQPAFQRNICPKCLKVYSMKRHHTKTEMVGPKFEQEIGIWHFKHDCGAHLEVFND